MAEELVSIRVEACIYRVSPRVKGEIFKSLRSFMNGQILVSDLMEQTQNAELEAARQKIRDLQEQLAGGQIPSF